MTDPYADRRFRRIETWARLPDGRVRTSWNSYPLGVGKDVYDAIDAALVRAYGNDNCRTTGTFYEDEGSCIKSDRTRREGLMPTPCIVCGRELDSAANDPAFDHVPYAGTMFATGGHYGSTVFDSFDGNRLEIVVCDECLKAHAATRVRLVDTDGQRTPWDGVTRDGTDDVDPDTPEGRARMTELLALFATPDTGVGPAHPGQGPSHDRWVAGLPDRLADKHRGWRISHDHPPIPDRSMDWSATSPDYDVSYEGPENRWVASGTRLHAATRQELVRLVDEEIGRADT